jgi:hypothetical protein
MCVQLYFTNPDVPSRPLPSSVDGLAVSIASGALIEGMPLILMDDGSYDLHLNRFFRACLGMGAHSPNTWRSSARDIFVWARFLCERRGGKTVWQVDRHDVLAFHRARWLSAAPYRISASSWNRGIAALDKFYRWAVEEGIMTTSPFSYAVTLHRTAGTRALLAVTANRSRERAARRHDCVLLILAAICCLATLGCAEVCLTVRKTRPGAAAMASAMHCSPTPGYDRFAVVRGRQPVARRSSAYVGLRHAFGPVRPSRRGRQRRTTAPHSHPPPGLKDDQRLHRS